MKLISIIVPVYNEEQSLPELHERLDKVFDKLKENYNFELIFVNDGSRDKSMQIINSICNNNNYAKFIDFSRNFGKEIATSAGLHHARGDAVVILDADLQHPPELIPQFLEKWTSDKQMIIGIRKKRLDKCLFKKTCSKLFYLIMNLISETGITANTTDFRLIDKKIINEFKNFTEHKRITRGILDWIGFDRDYVEFESPKRKYGKPGYSFIRLTRLAINSFVTHSLLPLKLAGYLGIFIVISSTLLGLYLIITQYILHKWELPFSGTAQLAVLTLFLIGIVLSCLGIIALYIGNIHAEVTNRPIYIIKNKKLD